MNFDHNLRRRPAPGMRWLSIFAVVIPVASFVMLTAWFVRTFIAPPTVAVPNSAQFAALPPPPPSMPTRPQVEAPKPQFAARETVAMAPQRAEAPPVQQSPAPAFAATLPMVASLAIAPIAPPSTAFDPVPESEPATAIATAAPLAPSAAVAVEPPQTVVAEPDAPQAGTPIDGPVPLPRPKHHITIAMAGGVVPLPRPKPAELAPAPDLPDVDRHAIQ